MRSPFFLSLVVLCSFNALAQESKGDTYFQEAKDWLDKGNNERAIQSFKAAQAAHLKTQNYYRYFVATQALSIVFQDTGAGHDAEKIILEAIKVIPKNSPEQLELHAKLQDNLGYTYLNNLNLLEKAVEAYSQSIQLYESAGKANTKSVAFELVNRSLAYQQLAQYQLSIADVSKAISIYEKDPDTEPQDLANHYYTLGLNYTEVEEFEKAIDSLQKGLQLIESLEKNEMHAQFYQAIGNTYNSQHRYQQAIESYTTAGKINESLFGKDSDHYCQSVISIGDTYKKRGDLETTLTHYQEALAIYQKTPPKELDNVIYLLLNVSKTMTGLGQSEKAEAINTQTIKFATESIGANSLAEAEVYKHLATVAFNQGEDEKSLTYNFKVLFILDANNYPKNGYYAEVYDAIGQAYDATDDAELALKYKQMAVDLYKKVYGPAHSSVAIAIGSISLTHEGANQYDQAIDYLNQSTALLLKSPESNKKELGITYMDIGRVSMKRKEIKKALEYLEKARAIFDSDSKSFNKAKVYNELGAAYFLANDVTKAAQCFQKSIIANTFNFEDVNIDSSPTHPDYINYYELVTSYISKADAYRIKKDKASLLKSFQQLDAADKLLKETSHRFSNTSDRLRLARLNSFFTEAGLLLMDKLYSLTKDAAYLEKAFYYSERSKANELLAGIRLNKVTSVSRIPKPILNRANDLSVRLNTLRQQIASAYTEKNESLITLLKSQELDLVKEQEELQNKMAELSPKLRALSNKTLPSWSDLKKTLDAKTVIVSYTMMDSAKYILIGNASSLVLKKIKPELNIDKIIRGYINQIKFKDAFFKETSGTLTDILWTPVEEGLLTLGVTNPDKIIIVPEGSLNYLPFESLGKEKFLAEKFTLHYSYSGALLLQSEKHASKDKPTFIALAPVFADKETNFVNKSCERFVQSAKKADTTSRAFSLNGSYITPLPGTRSEVEKINQLNIDKGLLSKFFLEEDASEELIKKGELEKFDYIHLATHGFVNNQYPELSGLLLTQNPKSTEDGILYSGEILGLNLDAELITLSACETALGKRVEGEGVRGLTTSFLFAGSKNVIASLWKVSDESTSKLMVNFYTELLSGKDKATALRLAKRSLIQTENYNHPYYWAPFIQVGSN